MAVPLSVNGAIFNYPQNFDTNWGIDATGWAQAVTSGMLQKAGGSFPLTADVDFGTSFGLKAAYLTSHTINSATSGTIRLASADPGVAFRNNANSTNLILTTDASDNLLYNGHIITGSASSPVTSITGTPNQVIASSPTGAVTLSLPQNIATASTPTFTALTLTGPSSLILGAANSTNGSITLYNSTTANYVQLAAGLTSSNYTIKLPVNAGLNGQVLQTDGTGVTSWVNAAGGGTVNSGTAGQMTYYAATGATVGGAPFLSFATNTLTYSPGTANAFLQVTGTNNALINFTGGGLNSQISTDPSGAFMIFDTDNLIRFFDYSRGGGGLVTFATPLAMSSHKITGLATPTTTNDALAYGHGFDVGSNKITGLAAATTTGDAVSYRQGGQAIDGSTANSGGSAGTVQQGTISTPDLRANAVTQVQSSLDTNATVATTNVTSKTITTIGGPVLIMATFSASILSNGTVANLQVTVDRGGTALHGGFASMSRTTASTTQTELVIATVDSQSAGTYTYNLTWSSTTGGISSTNGFSLVLVELRA